MITDNPSTLQHQASKPQNMQVAWKTANGDFLRPLADLTTIGCDLTCQIQVSGETVSPRHARIERRGEGYVLKDLRSSTGTFLNDTQILEAVLTPRDIIRVGQQELTFDQPATPMNLSRFEVLKTSCPSWKQQLDQIPSIAKTNHPVLLLGPSGTGKELVAKTLHALSLRAQQPFVSVNCSALSESLIESELFGHVKGSFTGATHDRPGAFATAQGGTLFLDEIGDFPLTLQPKLLRALENQEIRPVGSDQTFASNVRIIAATHHNLMEKVALGLFRADLFYRLHVVRISIPPLQQRPDDFQPLLFKFARENRVRISVDGIEALRRHSWPGNIRELKNAIARASALYRGQTITQSEVPCLIDHIVNPNQAQGVSAPTGQMPVIKEIEREMIIRRLIANHGNQRRTAADLNMPKSTLHDRLKTYNISVDEILGREPKKKEV